MQENDRSNRSCRLCIAGALCASSLLLAPLAARSSFETGDEPVAGVRISAPKLRAESPGTVTVLRDPFISDDPAAPPLEASNTLGTHVVQGAPIGFPIPPEGAVLRALVIGASPRALLEENGSARVVAVGDLVEGSPVVSIDAFGVRLANGQLLKLSADNR